MESVKKVPKPLKGTPILGYFPPQLSEDQT